jgi:hypothetical protein
MDQRGLGVAGRWVESVVGVEIGQRAERGPAGATERPLACEAASRELAGLPEGVQGLHGFVGVLAPFPDVAAEASDAPEGSRRGREVPEVRARYGDSVEGRERACRRAEGRTAKQEVPKGLFAKRAVFLRSSPRGGLFREAGLLGLFP